MSSTSPSYDIFISFADARELDRLLANLVAHDEAEESVHALSGKLFDAQVVSPETLPHGTVRLHATVQYEELADSRQRSVTLVPPAEADASAGRISVLSPVGQALLGTRLGRVVDVALPSGQRRAIRVVGVSSPDEVTGDAEPACA